MDRFVNFGQLENIIGKGVQAYNLVNSPIVADANRTPSTLLASNVTNDQERPVDENVFMWSVDYFGTRGRKVTK